MKYPGPRREFLEAVPKAAVLQAAKPEIGPRVRELGAARGVT